MSKRGCKEKAIGICISEGNAIALDVPALFCSISIYLLFCIQKGQNIKIYNHCPKSFPLLSQKFISSSDRPISKQQCSQPILSLFPNFQKRASIMNETIQLSLKSKNTILVPAHRGHPQNRFPIVLLRFHSFITGFMFLLGFLPPKWQIITLTLQQYLKVLMGLLTKALTAVVRRIFDISKEEAGSIAVGVEFARAYRSQFKNFKKGQPAVLRPPYASFNFPLPDRWTNSVAKDSLQHPHLLALQFQNTATPADQKKSSFISLSEDKSLANLVLMKNFDFTKRYDVATIEQVMERFGYRSFKYTLGRETLIGESVVNGENPYLLRRFNGKGITYDLAGSEAIENSYRRAIVQAFEKEACNDQNLKEAGLNQSGIVEELKNGRNAFSMFFEHLEHVSGGQPLVNKPTIFLDNETIKETYYLQSPYPVFVKVSNSDFEGFICIAVAFRYKDRLGRQSISVFSPFFSSQPYQVWKLAEAQMVQAYFNDFHMRVHLGMMHFTTNQYNVPIYNCLRAAGKEAVGFDKFIKHAYTMFNAGLEGVNVTGTVTLINKNMDYSIINKVFNFSPTNVMALISSYSNHLDMTTVTPDQLLAKNGLTKEDAEENFDIISMDLQLNSILSTYIKEVYDIFGMDAYAGQLKDAVNQETSNMGVNGGQARPALKRPEDVLSLIQSLAFCWVGYHSHTFATMPFAEYWDFRPSMIKKYVPNDPAEWEKIKLGEQLPNPIVMMSTSQIIGGVSQKDPENFLVDILRKKAFNAKYVKDIAETQLERQQYAALQISARKALDALQEYGVRCLEINKQRLAKNKPLITWMHPSVLQSSLNI